MTAGDHLASFNFYGLKLGLRSSDALTIEYLRRDFRYFEKTNGEGDFNIHILEKPPDYQSLPAMPASNYTIDYVTFRSKETVFTDYHGKGLRIYNTRERTYHIYSSDPDLRHEIAYLTVLSSVGRYLDLQHIHRVHALAVVKNGIAILVLLPEKGGKTTLALRLLRTGKFKLLSEDSPLLTRSGEILPFPLRMGILPGEEPGIPSHYIYRSKFLRIGTKVLIDLDYFADKIAQPSRPGFVFLGERVLGNKAAILPAGIFTAAKKFIANSVVGMGLHQGMEYLLGSNIFETISRSGLACSRLNNSLKVLRLTKVYRYQIGHDFENNIQVLLDFLH